MFSLSFLNSGVLFLSSAIIIPVLIYLFAKKKPKKIIFSSIRFIKESQKNQRRKINLKNLLLLLIRMLIILLTILAISRPAIKAPFLKKNFSHAKTAIALIIDNSYSMDYLVDTQTELDKAKNIALEINELLTDRDLVVPFTLDKNWNDLNSNAVFGKLPAKQIRRISITSNALSFTDIIKSAEKKLKESHYLNKEIYIISDLQKQKLPKKTEIPCFFIPTSQTKERINLSCQNSHLSADFTHRNSQRKISFEIVNHSDFAQTDVICQLILNERTVSEKICSLKPKQKKREYFSINLEKSGIYSGYVQVKNERLPFDNRNYFAFNYNSSPTVAVVSDSSDIPLPLKTILEIYTNPTNIRIYRSENYDPEKVLDSDIIIIYKKKILSEKLLFLLEKIQNKNKKFLFIAEKNLSSEWKAQIEKIFGIQLLNFVNNPVLLKFTNQYHPVTEIIKIDENITFSDFWSATQTENSTLLISSSELPFALEKNGNLLWLFDIQSSRNDFFLSSAFPVFAYNSLSFIASNSSQSKNLKIGDKIHPNCSILELPSGESIQVNTPFFFVSEPGIYKCENDAFAVNLDYQESDYKRFDKINAKNIKLLDKNWKNEIFRTRYGFEIWKILLILVILLFILEMSIIKKEERKT